jgi:hypothetical protein
MNPFNLLPLRVHCWGGLGSQLYALSTVFDLRRRFPQRKIKLVLHTSGVTKRESELELDFIQPLSIEIIQVNDFVKGEFIEKVPSTSFRIVFKSILKSLIFGAGIFSTANNDLEFGNIRSWTLSIRGHYFDRTVSIRFYEYLLRSMNITKNSEVSNKYSIAIHYRTGDLINLSQKSIIPASKVTDQIKLISENHDNPIVTVYTESVDEVKNMLSKSSLPCEFTVVNAPTIEVIRLCAGADYFIGTNSKISLWIANIRRYRGNFNESILAEFGGRLFMPPGSSAVS